ALCAALIIFVIAPAGALNATYAVLPNATSYAAQVEITDTSTYQFANADLLGENIPVNVTNVSLIADNGTPVNFNGSAEWMAPSIITFPKGNYTISYETSLQDNQIQGSFLEPYNVSVFLPVQYDVRNPLLATLSPGANVTRFPDNTTAISWNDTTSFNLRFYDQAREDLLYVFGEFMIILAIILLTPFLLMRKPPE